MNNGLYGNAYIPPMRNPTISASHPPNLKYTICVTKTDDTMAYIIVDSVMLNLQSYNLNFAMLNGWIKEWTYL